MQDKHLHISHLVSIPHISWPQQRAESLLDESHIQWAHCHVVLTPRSESSLGSQPGGIASPNQVRPLLYWSRTRNVTINGWASSNGHAHSRASFLLPIPTEHVRASIDVEDCLVMLAFEQSIACAAHREALHLYFTPLRSHQSIASPSLDQNLSCM